MERMWSTYLEMDSHSPRSSLRPASVASHANSAYSNSGSARHILADMSSQVELINHNNGNGPPPSLSNLSLSVNYIPSKFSSSPISPGALRKRKSTHSDALPKHGGGVDAFRSGENRMSQGGKSRMRWTSFKWVLIVANVLLMIWSVGALIVCLLTYFDVWNHADVVRTGNRTELVLSTFAAALGVFTSVVGWAGILLNNRGFLAWYTFLSWVTFAFLVVPGYITYKKRTFNLEGKINAQWSRSLGADGRLRIQNQLECCGYFSPFIEATISQTCYARSILPGCKLPYLQFERRILGYWFRAVFSVVPIQMFVMIAALLCSNHITFRFGKGMMPEAYRLNLGTMAVIMDNYANQLAEQYGPDVAHEVLKRSQSNLNLSSSSPDLTPPHTPLAPFHAKYSSLSRSAADK